MNLEHPTRSQRTFLEEVDSWLQAFGEASRKDKQNGATVDEKVQKAPEGRRALENERIRLAGD